MALKRHFLCYISSAGLVGYRNIVDRFLIAHIKDIDSTYVLPTSSTICKFRMTLKRYFGYYVSNGEADANRLPELLRVMFNGLFKSFCLYPRNFGRFYHP